MNNVVTSPDFVTIVTNVGVFLAAAGTVVVAIWSAAKKIKNAMPAEETTHKVVGGMIMDTTTLLMWSESNRHVVDGLSDLQHGMGTLEKEMTELRFAVTQLKDKL